jgi:hypothetical protein
MKCCWTSVTLLRAQFVWRFEKSSAQPIEVDVNSTFILFITDAVAKIVFQHEHEDFQQALVVMLDTGNAAIDPCRSGPATAIVIKDTAYLVDFGAGVSGALGRLCLHVRSKRSPPPDSESCSPRTCIPITLVSMRT